MGKNDFNALSILREVQFALVDIYANNRMNQAKNLNILYSVSCSLLNAIVCIVFVVMVQPANKGVKVEAALT